MPKAAWTAAALCAVAGLIVALAAAAAHHERDLAATMEHVVRFASVPLAFVGLAGVFAAVISPAGAQRTAPTGAAALLLSATLLGLGGWGAPLAAAACLVLPLLAARRDAAPVA